MVILSRNIDIQKIRNLYFPEHNPLNNPKLTAIYQHHIIYIKSSVLEIAVALSDYQLKYFDYLLFEPSDFPSLNTLVITECPIVCGGFKLNQKLFRTMKFLNHFNSIHIHNKSLLTKSNKKNSCVVTKTYLNTKNHCT